MSVFKFSVATCRMYSVSSHTSSSHATIDNDYIPYMCGCRYSSHYFLDV